MNPQYNYYRIYITFTWTLPLADCMNPGVHEVHSEGTLDCTLNTFLAVDPIELEKDYDLLITIQTNDTHC